MPCVQISWQETTARCAEALPMGSVRAWETQAVRWAEELRTNVDSTAWTGRHDFKGHGVPNHPRVRTLLNLTCHQKLQEARLHASGLQQQPLPHVFKEAFLDWSQNPCRRAFSDRCGMLRCLCSSTTLYSYQEDRALFPIEYLRLQGWGFETKIPESCHGKVREMAGQGIALPCLGTVVWALYLVKGLPSSEESRAGLV